VSHHGRSAVELGDGAEVDGESKNDLLPLSQSEVRRLYENAGGAEIDRLTKLTTASWNHDVDDRPSTMSRMQAAFH
jgi:hypothetical protein